MQSEVALSTTEAEYIALSQSMRDLFSMRNMFKEIAVPLGISTTAINTYSKAFEDKKGLQELASSERYRPRTKNIAIKYHHFREHVKNGVIKII